MHTTILERDTKLRAASMTENHAPFLVLVGTLVLMQREPAVLEASTVPTDPVVALILVLKPTLASVTTLPATFSLEKLATFLVPRVTLVPQ